MAIRRTCSRVIAFLPETLPDNHIGIHDNIADEDPGLGVVRSIMFSPNTIPETYEC